MRNPLISHQKYLPTYGRFSRGRSHIVTVVNGCWKWGEYSIPIASSYSYLGIDFSSNGAWDVHIRRLLDNGRRRVNQLH